jgi:dihydrofolate reductase
MIQFLKNLFSKKKYKYFAKGIVSVDKKTWGIACKNKEGETILPSWTNRKDMKWFKNTTIVSSFGKKNVLICGGETFRSMDNKPLNHRHMIIVSPSLMEKCKSLTHFHVDCVVPTVLNVDEKKFFGHRYSMKFQTSAHINSKIKHGEGRYNVHNVLEITDHNTNCIYVLVNSFEAVSIALGNMKFSDIYVMGGNKIYSHFMGEDNNIIIDKFYISKMNETKEMDFNLFFPKDTLMKKYKLNKNSINTKDISPDVIEVYNRK